MLWRLKHITQSHFYVMCERAYMYVYTAHSSTQQWIATRFIEKDRTLLFYNVVHGQDLKRKKEVTTMLYMSILE